MRQTGDVSDDVNIVGTDGSTRKCNAVLSVNYQLVGSAWTQARYQHTVQTTTNVTLLSLTDDKYGII